MFVWIPIRSLELVLSRQQELAFLNFWNTLLFSHYYYLYTWKAFLHAYPLPYLARIAILDSMSSSSMEEQSSSLSSTYLRGMSIEKGMGHSLSMDKFKAGCLPSVAPFASTTSYYKYQGCLASLFNLLWQASEQY
ncbi:hypothetical protein FGO68_gene14362 [Halteria grandinella]|uniref:Uncharacterized protein n=1 Tax=Halteria grandinella TaxID=5974 RepID=A0A8J8NBR0_HALGN|nr:hypothetical protein FGO68_gene14362 [Halteria grandinella]